MPAPQWSRALLLSLLAAAPVAAQTDPGQLYVRVTTMRGDVHEGFLRWDVNEGHATDVLDASKLIARRYLEEEEALGGARAPGPRQVRILGVSLRVRDDASLPTRQSGLRMGQIKRLSVLDDEHALVTFRSGVEQELQRSSTDLGGGNRGIRVYGAGRERPVTLDWDQVDFIEFLPIPATARSPWGARLYGQLETRSGREFTGWITWDMDEIYGGDVLDGDDEATRTRRKIAFQDIARIVAVSSRQAEVTLKSGDVLTLSGTNDVNGGNRGIAVGDPGLGQVRIGWDDFRAVTLRDAPAVPLRFDAVRPLSGTVRTREGETFRGPLRWDNDEAWTWELLDGESDGMEMKIEFGLIAAITPASASSAVVTLRDGREFELTGSNDVGDRNRGVIVEVEGRGPVLVRWKDLERVDFDR